MQAAGSAGRTPGAGRAAAGSTLAPAGGAPAPRDVLAAPPSAARIPDEPRHRQHWGEQDAATVPGAGSVPGLLAAELRASPGTCRGVPRTSRCRAGPLPTAFSELGWGSGGVPNPAPSPLKGAPGRTRPAGSRSPCPHPPWAGARWPSGAAAAPAWPRAIDQAAPAGVRCTSPRSFVGLLLHIPGHQYFNGLEVPFYRSFWVVFIFLLLGSIAVSIAFKDCRNKR